VTGLPLAAGPAAAAELPAKVLVALAAILVTARLAGAAARRIDQPAVVGEIVAGLALGPSLLGLLPGDLTHLLFPTETRPVLSSVAQLGLVLFMFLVGLESDMGLLRGRVRLAASVSITSIVLPFTLGIPLAIALHGRHDGGKAADLLPFLLFIGASLSITAFPVLARILAERSMERTPLGTLALASAALDDVIAWSMLAVVVAIVANGGPAAAGTVGLLAVAYGAVMLLLVRPALTRLAPRLRKDGQVDAEAFTVILVLLLLSAWVTDRIGIHLVFGAFALGAVFPRDGAFRQAVAEKVESVSLLLLPVFFVSTGLGVDLAEMGGRDLAELGLVLAVAVGGKVGGAMLGARVNGLGLRRSTALGVLANTRGLTELVILSIGRQLGVLDERLYGVLVLMAVITTAMAGPLLALVYPDRLVQQDLADLDRAAEGASTVIVQLPAEDRTGADGSRAFAVAVGADLARSATHGHVVLSRVLPPPAPGLGVAALAELAGVLDEVSRECRALLPLGVSAAPTVTRAADPVAHAAQQAARLEADWVVGTLPVWTGTDVVVVGARTADPVPTAPVLLLDDGAAAWEAAVRLATVRGVPLAVSAGRATRRLEDAAREVGGVVVEPDRHSPVSLVVAGPGPQAPEDQGLAAVPVVTVYPGPDGPHELRDRVDRILMGLPEPGPEAASSSPARSSSAALSPVPSTVAPFLEEPS
jgi:Kef-type K+ transport system membrane component KefB